MARKLKPSDVASQLGHDINEITEFAADMLEDANDHNVAAALRALAAGAYDIACDFIKLEKEQDAAGELTQPIREQRELLMDRLDKFDPDADEEHVCDDDCRSYGCSAR